MKRHGRTLALAAFAATLFACQADKQAEPPPSELRSSVSEATYAGGPPPLMEPEPDENDDFGGEGGAAQGMPVEVAEEEPNAAAEPALGLVAKGNSNSDLDAALAPPAPPQGIINAPEIAFQKRVDLKSMDFEQKPMAGELLDAEGLEHSRDATGAKDDLGDQPNDGKLEEKARDYRQRSQSAADNKEVLANERGKSGNLGGMAGPKRPTTTSTSVTVDTTGIDAMRYVRPEQVLPRTFYFENTYLGGSAAYAERLRKLDAALAEGERPYRLVVAESQPFDAPRTDGLSLHASIDASHFDDPRRVFLQVGIQGSQRYGWRRPPIDAMLVLDHVAFANGPRAVIDFIAAALRQLDHTDRLGVLIAGADGVEEVLPLTRLDTARQALAHRIDTLSADPAGGTQRTLSDAMRRAGAILAQASESPNTIPGTQMVLIMSGATSQGAVRAATFEAHTLTVQGAVTSIFTASGEALPWWQLADAGYGNWHRLNEVGPEQAFTDELAALARVVARLIRVNIRLGKGAHAVRVLGTRVLEAKEVERVKAREVAADRNLSKTMGISADRGDDDDGIQTVIPYFLGDDSHVILVELWLDEPGVVADVSLRYKDMVNLENAAARTSVLIGSRPQPDAPEQEWIARNVNGFLLGEELQRASVDVQNGAFGSASAAIQRAQGYARHTNDDDWQAVEQMETMINNRNVAPSVMSDNLLMSGQRRIGTTLK